ncbi:MAG: hypothetical protein J7577_10550 [Sphingobacteriaceae bacterium]|nr:hypothetical protein [Sphingobacteriaceae bacterium]
MILQSGVLQGRRLRFKAQATIILNLIQNLSSIKGLERLSHPDLRNTQFNHRGYRVKARSTQSWAIRYYNSIFGLPTSNFGLSPLLLS